MAPAKLRWQGNAELSKYRANSGFLASGTRSSAVSRLSDFVFRLLLVALWKSIGALAVPFGKLFAVYFWLGKSVVTLSLWLEKRLLNLVGWLSGTAFGRNDRIGRISHFYVGADVKRWHLGLGGCALRAARQGRTFAGVACSAPVRPLPTLPPTATPRRPAAARSCHRGQRPGAHGCEAGAGPVRRTGPAHEAAETAHGGGL